MRALESVSWRVRLGELGNDALYTPRLRLYSLKRDHMIHPQRVESHGEGSSGSSRLKQRKIHSFTPTPP